MEMALRKAYDLHSPICRHNLWIDIQRGFDIPWNFVISDTWNRICVNTDIFETDGLGNPLDEKLKARIKADFEQFLLATYQFNRRMLNDRARTNFKFGDEKEEDENEARGSGRYRVLGR